MKMINVIKTLFISGILTVILFAVSTIELKADNPCPFVKEGCQSIYNNGCCIYFDPNLQIDCTRYINC